MSRRNPIVFGQIMTEINAHCVKTQEDPKAGDLNISDFIRRHAVQLQSTARTAVHQHAGAAGVGALRAWTGLKIAGEAVALASTRGAISTNPCNDDSGGKKKSRRGPATATLL